MTQSIFKQYLNDIARYPLLTPQQEIQLGRAITRLQELRGLDRELTPEEKRECKIGVRARERFIQCNLQLVVHIAKRYENSQRKSLEIMDLIQEGNIGLARAVEKFDYSRGYKFSTYGYWWIKQAIRRAIGQIDDMIRLPHNLHDLMYHVSRAGQNLSHELGRMPTVQEIATRLGIDPSKVIRAFHQFSKIVSLDLKTADDNASAIVDLIADPRWQDSQEDTEAQHLLYMYDKYLDDKTKFIIQSRLAARPLSWTELEKQAKIPRVKLQQIERRGILRLKALMGVVPDGEQLELAHVEGS